MRAAFANLVWQCDPESEDTHFDVDRATKYLGLNFKASPSGVHGACLPCHGVPLGSFSSTLALWLVLASEFKLHVVWGQFFYEEKGTHQM